jgi:hypothetical protein
MSEGQFERSPSARGELGGLAAKERSKMAEAVPKAGGEAARAALIGPLSKLPHVSEEESIASAVKLIEGATTNGLTEVLVCRFSASLCTDRGRAISRHEREWEATLTGVPREIYDLWVKFFRDQGYRLKVQVIDTLDDMPGEIGMTLSWG